MDQSGDESAHGGGLLQSLRNLAATAVGTLRVRLELLVLELEEERLRLAQLLVWGCIALVCVAIGMLLLTAAIVMALWDTHPILVTVLLGIAYVGIGIALFAAVRRRVRGSKLLSGSLAELSKDYDRLIRP